MGQKIVGRGAAYADIDNDGDLDFVITQIDGPPLLIRVDQDLNNNWIRFKLEGKSSNRDGIGAWIEVSDELRTQKKQLMPTKSYISQMELPVTFGLGKAQKIKKVKITWPGGKAQELKGPFKMNSTLKVSEDGK